MAACALVLAACGGDDDAERIRAVITEAATVDDPAHCTELLTPAFVDQSEAGEDPLAECEQSEAAGNDAADSVEVSAIAVDGDAATAEVAITGGPSGGQSIRLALVKDGEDWKLDRITDFIAFDRESYFDALAAEFATTQQDAPPGLADCALDALRGLSDEEIEELLLSGDDDRSTELVARACPEPFREAVMIRLEPAFAGMDPGVRACVVAALRDLSDGRFLDLALDLEEAVLQEFVNARCADAAGA